MVCLTCLAGLLRSEAGVSPPGVGADGSLFIACDASVRMWAIRSSVADSGLDGNDDLASFPATDASLGQTIDELQLRLSGQIQLISLQFRWSGGW